MEWLYKISVKNGNPINGEICHRIFKGLCLNRKRILHVEKFHINPIMWLYNNGGKVDRLPRCAKYNFESVLIEYKNALQEYLYKEKTLEKIDKNVLSIIVDYI